MEHDKREKKADQFFRRELIDSDVQKSVHYTFKDGFRLGFGFFIGFMLGTLILILFSSAINMIFKVL
ncbi:MAG: hypothetical protein WCK71_02050 [bacterium]